MRYLQFLCYTLLCVCSMTAQAQNDSLNIDQIQLNNDARLHLSGIGMHTNLNRVLYVGALYLDNDQHDLTTDGPKRLSMHIIAKRISKRGFMRIWNDSIYLDPDDPDYSLLSETLTNFGNLLPGNLRTNDIVHIDYIPSNGVRFSVNNIYLGKINSEELISLLIEAWAGTSSPSPEFTDGILGQLNDTQAEKYRNLYQEIRPKPARIAQVQQWRREIDNAAAQRRKTQAKAKAAREAEEKRKQELLAAEQKKIEQAQLEKEKLKIQLAEEAKKAQEALLLKQQQEELEKQRQAEEAAEQRKIARIHRSKLYTWIRKYHRYPKKAIRRRLEGATTLKVTIDREGQVVSTEIVKSSNERILDREAVNIMKKASPLPKLPDNLTGETFSFDIRLTFKPAS